jgi:soluble lytic murein transglycosylase
MREESGFDRWARSWAGAIGLTQLMPRTARAVASELKLGRVTPAALHAPQLNIRVGAAYLGELLSTPGLEGARRRGVQRGAPWWSAGRRAPDAEHDYGSSRSPRTRDDVKRVLGSYAAYRLLYGGAFAALEERGATVPGHGLTGRLTRQDRAARGSLAR